MRRSIVQALGPGLLWAGTAVGVSHLVQSTRAGAMYGLGLLWLVILANLFKYPAFEAGPRYTMATGKSLLEGYRRRGTWTLWVFLALTFATMFTVLAAVTIVTAGMAAQLLTDQLPVAVWSGLILVVASSLLAADRFRYLEAFMKVMMILLTGSTLCSVGLLLPKLWQSSVPMLPMLPEPLDGPSLIFLAALAGWMPSAIDTAVWQSLWALEKERAEGVKATAAESALDFNVGYIGTAVLACLFVTLGAAVVHGSGTELPQSASAFAARLVDLYVVALGEWARPLILLAAFSTMVSTTVAVADGFPRALEAAVNRLRTPEAGPEVRGPVYYLGLVGCGLGAMLIIVQFAGQLKALVDVATTLTGLTAPMLATLNYVTVCGEEVPEAHRPSGTYRLFHLAGIGFLSVMALAYLIGRFAM